MLMEELEIRVVLSHVSIRAASAHVHKLNGPLAGRSLVSPVVTQINTAFDSFTTDYTQARGIYLSILASTSNSTSANSAFSNYTRNRIDLLAQQLDSVFLHASSSQSSKHQNQNSGSNLYRLVATRVNGRDTSSTSPAITFKSGTLGHALAATTPAGSIDAPSIALDSLAQDEAIQTSRLAVINGFEYNKGLSASQNHK
jgi:hypothetical protein